MVVATRYADLPSGLARQLAALSEGTCPRHLAPLRATGWCPPCQCWWTADYREHVVITTYPFPGIREPEP
jgi:hypothetical protein